VLLKEVPKIAVFDKLAVRDIGEQAAGQCPRW
jgi:hypothetical protein